MAAKATGEEAKPPRRDAGKASQDAWEKQLQAENAALRAELDRLRARYEGPWEPPPIKKESSPEPEPEQFALVGPGKRVHRGPSDEALDSVDEMLCRTLQERQLGTRWRYYRDELLVPEGVTFFYAHDALRKMWGETPGDPDPPAPQAFRRLTEAERDERDGVFRSALSRAEAALERSEKLHAEGHVVADTGLLR